MALDGTLLRQIRHELEGVLIGARIDKIHQISREEMIFILRLPQPTADGARSVKLYLSAGADSPRLHLTGASFENPKAPPMFCMLMRKYLGSAKLLRLEQIGLDRILHLTFETRNEMGDLIELTVAVEIMGRHSNIILIGEDGRVIDSIKRIDDTMSSVRPILPGVRYTLPPAQDKLDLIDCTPQQVEERLRQGKDTPLSKALLAAVQGVSPIVCREIANYVFTGDDRVISEMTSDHFDRLRFFLARVIELAKNYTGTPTSVIDSRKKPVDFSFMDIHQYGGMMFTRTYPTYSQLLDDFYTQRDSIQRMRHRSADLLKILANTASPASLLCSTRSWRTAPTASAGRCTGTSSAPTSTPSRRATAQRRWSISMTSSKPKSPSRWTRAKRRPKTHRNTTANTARQTPPRKSCAS